MSIWQPAAFCHHKTHPFSSDVLHCFICCICQTVRNNRLKFIFIHITCFFFFFFIKGNQENALRKKLVKFQALSTHGWYFKKLKKRETTFCSSPDVSCGGDSHGFASTLEKDELSQIQNIFIPTRCRKTNSHVLQFLLLLFFTILSNTKGKWATEWIHVDLYNSIYMENIENINMSVKVKATRKVASLLSLVVLCNHLQWEALDVFVFFFFFQQGGLKKCVLAKKIQYQSLMLHQRGEEKSAVILFVLVWKNVVPCSHLPVQHTAEDNIQYIHYINRYTHIHTHLNIQSSDVHTHTQRAHIVRVDGVTWQLFVFGSHMVSELQK